MLENNGSGVSIGIDAAVVADHQVAIRGPGIREDFRVAPTLAGLTRLTKRLSPYAGSLVIAEPTAGTWIPLAAAVADADCEISFVQSRHSAKLRQAIAGRSKTDVIDADMLARSTSVFDMTAAAPLDPVMLGLRRLLTRRHKLTVAAHRVECRLWSVGSWAFPDVWRACGGHQVAQPLLRRWPHLQALARARVSSITDVVATHSRDRQPQRRAERIRAGAAGWAQFWEGRIDLDLLAWETTQLLDDIVWADDRQRQATDKTLTQWRTHWPDDLLLTIAGVGPICAAATRAWWGDGTQLPSAKAAGAFVGLNPSNWESGLTEAPSRPITKEGPPALRLAYYQAANIARRRDPALAAHYRKLRTERRHTHMQANCAIARKLTARTWAVLNTRQPYQHRDLDGNPINETDAVALAESLAVPTDIQQRTRTSRRGRLGN
ncbi:MAG: IS110 family RNA-guided transposase [Planctomycetota bacterium]|jgi:transposase